MDRTILDELCDRLYYSLVALGSMILVGSLAASIRDLQIDLNINTYYSDTIVSICKGIGFIIFISIVFPTILILFVRYFDYLRYKKEKRKGH